MNPATADPAQVPSARQLGEAAGVGAVSPVGLGSANPQRVGQDWWVVYPWVEGTAYAGTTAQVAQAGDFLGRLGPIPGSAATCSTSRSPHRTATRCLAGPRAAGFLGREELDCLPAGSGSRPRP